MPKDDTSVALVMTPQFADLENETVQFQRSLHEERRLEFLEQLRLTPGFAAAAKKVIPSQTYKIVLAPRDGKLYKDAAGILRAVFYKDGKIVQQARLKAIGPSLLGLASAVGSQVLLISIAMQLHRVEEKVDRLLDGAHGDRVAEVFAGIEQSRRAFMAKSVSNRAPLLHLAIQTLNTGLAKTMRDLAKEIKMTPSPTNSLGDNWMISKASKAAETMARAEESFFACLAGTRALAECYAALDEHGVASVTLQDYVRHFREAGIEEAAEKARLVPAKHGVFPEQSWLEYAALEKEILAASAALMKIHKLEYEEVTLEATSKEIVGG